MTEGPDGGDAHTGDEAALEARHSWIAEHLGTQWRSDGDGVYRFVGPTTRPRADLSGVEDELTDALAPTRREEQWEADETPSTQKPHSPWAPWRNR